MTAKGKRQTLQGEGDRHKASCWHGSMANGKGELQGKGNRHKASCWRRLMAKGKRQELQAKGKLLVEFKAKGKGKHCRPRAADANKRQLGGKTNTISK